MQLPPYLKRPSWLLSVSTPWLQKLPSYPAAKSAFPLALGCRSPLQTGPPRRLCPLARMLSTKTDEWCAIGDAGVNLRLPRTSLPCPFGIEFTHAVAAQFSLSTSTPLDSRRAAPSRLACFLKHLVHHIVDLQTYRCIPVVDAAKARHTIARRLPTVSRNGGGAFKLVH